MRYLNILSALFRFSGRGTSSVAIYRWEIRPVMKIEEFGNQVIAE